MMRSGGALGEGQGRPFPGKWVGHPDLLSLARGQLQARALALASPSAQLPEGRSCLHRDAPRPLPSPPALPAVPMGPPLPLS